MKKSQEHSLTTFIIIPSEPQAKVYFYLGRATEFQEMLQPQHFLYIYTLHRPKTPLIVKINALYFFFIF